MKCTLAIILSLAFAAAHDVKGPNYGKVTVNSNDYAGGNTGPYGDSAYAGSYQYVDALGYSACGAPVRTAASAGTGSGASASKCGGVNAGSGGGASGYSYVG